MCVLVCHCVCTSEWEIHVFACVCVCDRFQKIAVGQIAALDNVTYEVMFIAVQDNNGR